MNQNSKFDLEERTMKFSGDVISFCQSLKRDIVVNPLISQLARSSTSIGANYCEANNASSKKDFANKIYICKKECQETKYWLKLIKTAQPEVIIVDIWQECHELNLIFQKIVTSIKS